MNIYLITSFLQQKLMKRNRVYENIGFSYSGDLRTNKLAYSMKNEAKRDTGVCINFILL